MEKLSYQGPGGNQDISSLLHCDLIFVPARNEISLWVLNYNYAFWNSSLTYFSFWINVLKQVLPEKYCLPISLLQSLTSPNLCFPDLISLWFKDNGHCCLLNLHKKSGDWCITYANICHWCRLKYCRVPRITHFHFYHSAYFPWGQLESYAVFRYMIDLDSISGT